MARESKESVRDRILSAAEARFWHYGIKKTTIDEIAADADVGKGTVYLHFESKEEVAIAIITQYKQHVLDEQRAVAADHSRSAVERLKKMLSLPIARAHERCLRSQYALELIAAVRPQLVMRLRDLYDEEVKLVESVLADGNTSGEMHIDSPPEVAGLLKLATLNFMPGTSACDVSDQPTEELCKLVDYLYQGLR